MCTEDVPAHQLAQELRDQPGALRVAAVLAQDLAVRAQRAAELVAHLTLDVVAEGWSSGSDSDPVDPAA